MEIERGDVFIVDLNPSVLLCEQIRVIDKKRLVNKMGNIGEAYLREVAVAIKVILGVE
ncbi:MAG: type II toxin-antitoxin system PemK/MazF family toxin [Dehalococcoidia bacterium]